MNLPELRRAANSCIELGLGYIDYKREASPENILELLNFYDSLEEEVDRLRELYDERLAPDQLELLGIKEVIENSNGKKSAYFVNERADKAEAKYDSLHAAAVRLAQACVVNAYDGEHDLCQKCHEEGAPILHTPTCPVGVVMSLEGK